MSLLDRLRELSALHEDAEPVEVADEREPEETSGETEQEVFRKMLSERRAARVEADNNPNLYVYPTRAKGGFGVDFVTRDGRGREISRERKP